MTTSSNQQLLSQLDAEVVLLRKELEVRKKKKEENQSKAKENTTENCVSEKSDNMEELKKFTYYILIVFINLYLTFLLLKYYQNEN